MKDFLKHEFFILSIGGAFQRGNIYKERPERNKEDFKRNLEKELNRISKKYISKVSEKKHIRNIGELINFSRNYKILNGGKLRFGIAQKLLNLYLKYLWCSEIVGMPPHCPFDRTILNELKIKENWTKSDKLSDYLTWVDLTKKEAKKENLTIAKWELKKFNRKNGTN